MTARAAHTIARGLAALALVAGLVGCQPDRGSAGRPSIRADGQAAPSASAPVGARAPGGPTGAPAPAPPAATADAGQSAGAEGDSMTMTADQVQVLSTSTDPKELVKAAIAAARSPEPAHHDLLKKHLESGEFLGRLDSEEDYRQAAGRRLRVSRVLEALAVNPLPSARSAFVALAANPVVLAEDERTIALLQASAAVRPAPPELAAFWDKHAQPDDGFTPTTVTVLIENGSPLALALFEKKMADPRHEEGDKIAWMRSRILPHRNDAPLLEACERLLQGGLPKHLRPALVEVLFDYRPGEWYRPASIHSPPDRRKAAPEALGVLRRIGERSLKSIPLSETQRKAVEATLEEIKKLLP
ncbi:hypothetical protein WMF38_06520 [Sorangium sp. So ce118]